MKNNQLQLRKIVIVAIIIIFALLISAIALSILWPPSWNPLLGSLLINIAASLIGVLVGVFIAIFFVERYLEHQRREKRKREHLLKVYWIYGGLSVLTAMIMHLSFFLLYGTKKWQALMVADNEQIKVPEKIGDFIPWLIDTKDKLRPSATKEKLALFEKEFNQRPKSSIKISREDLRTLLNYMDTCVTRIRDQILLFQPFIDEHFELVSSLVFFTRSLDNVAHDSRFSLVLIPEEGKLPASFHLDDKGQVLFWSLGNEAVKVSKLLLADYTAKDSEESPINP